MTPLPFSIKLQATFNDTLRKHEYLERKPVEGGFAGIRLCAIATLGPSRAGAGAAPLQILRGYQRVGGFPTPALRPFLLASIARFLYPIGCLASERPRP